MATEEAPTKRVPLPVERQWWRTQDTSTGEFGLSLSRLQSFHGVWQRYNFPTTPAQALLGVAEEVGELCHAQLKMEQGIRGDQEVKRKDAVGDIVMYLINYCNATDISFEECIERSWLEIRDRDFVRYPLNGRDQ